MPSTREVASVKWVENKVIRFGRTDAYNIIIIIPTQALDPTAHRPIRIEMGGRGTLHLHLCVLVLVLFTEVIHRPRKSASVVLALIRTGERETEMNGFMRIRMWHNEILLPFFSVTGSTVPPLTLVWGFWEVKLYRLGSSFSAASR